MKRLLLLLLSVVMVLGMSATVSFAGACCLLDGNCMDYTLEACDGAGGVYQGDLSACDDPIECPSVEIINVSVDRAHNQGEPPIYRRGYWITYTIEYKVGGPDPTYDLKAVVKPRFGVKCRKELPEVGIRGTARQRGLVPGDDADAVKIMTIETRPISGNHYKIPRCAKQDKFITVKYLLKLYKQGTTELVARDRLIETDQFYILPLDEDQGGHNTCIACHGG